MKNISSLWFAIDAHYPSAYERVVEIALILRWMNEVCQDLVAWSARARHGHGAMLTAARSRTGTSMLHSPTLPEETL